MNHQKTLNSMFVNERCVVPQPLTEDEIIEHVESYNRAKIPWDHLAKYYRYRLALGQKTFVAPELTEPQDLYDFPDNKDIVDRFFCDGNPRLLPRMGMFVDYWVLWEVTLGRFRSDHNKKMKVFKFEKPETVSMLRWAETLKQSKPSDWLPVPDDVKYDTFITITDMCNDVLSRIRRRLQETEITTNSARACFENMNRHPEFVPFQNNRTRDHQKFMWRYQAKRLGGNQGYGEPAKSLCIAKQSVHFILREIHEWLPSIRRRRTKRRTI
jgi:hypothetical protein